MLLAFIHSWVACCCSILGYQVLLLVLTRGANSANTRHEWCRWSFEFLYGLNFWGFEFWSFFLDSIIFIRKIVTIHLFHNRIIYRIFSLLVIKVLVKFHNDWFLKFVSLVCTLRWNLHILKNIFLSSINIPYQIWQKLILHYAYLCFLINFFHHNSIRLIRPKDIILNYNSWLIFL